MAILNFTGFETGDTAELYTTNGTYSIQSSIVRTGSYALQANPTTSNTGGCGIGKLGADGQSTSAFNIATTYIRFYFYVATAPTSNSEQIFSMMTTALGLKAELRIDSDRKLSIYNKTPNLLETGDTVLSLNTWYRIELKIGTGSSADYEVLLNGVTELSGTGDLHTTNGGFCRFGKYINRNSNTIDYYYDDVCINDSEYPGQGETRRIGPIADGATHDWHSGTGTTYEVVDEVPKNDSDYLQCSTSGDQTHLVTLDTCSSQSIYGTINSFKAGIRCKEYASATSSNKLRLVSGGTTVDTTGRNLSNLTWAYTHLLSNTDPNTSAAWTISGIDSVQVGVNEANSVAMQCSAMYGMVEFTPTVLCAATQTSPNSTQSLTGIAPIVFKCGINFRATSDYVVDGTDETYCIGDDYPTTRNGATFGWVNSFFDRARDRDSGLNQRLAGTNQVGNSDPQQDFRLNLPAVGLYSIKLALGDGGYDQLYARCEILDNTTSLFVVEAPDGFSAAEFFDATGTKYSAANWIANNTAVEKNFSSQILILRLGSPVEEVNNSPIAHLYVEYLGFEGEVSQTAPSFSQSIVAQHGTEATTGEISQTAKISEQQISGSETFNVAVSQTHKIASQAISGSETISGSIGQTPKIETQQISSLLEISGTIEQTTNLSSQSISGSETISGSIGQTATKSGQQATSSLEIIGSIDQTAKAFSQGVSSLETISGAVSQSHKIASQAISGSETISGAVSQSHKIASQAISGSETIAGSIGQEANKSEQIISGSEEISGSISQSSKISLQSVSGTETITGSASQISVNGQQEIAGTSIQNVDGSIVQTSQSPSQSASGIETISGSINQSTTKTNQSVSSTEDFRSSISQTLNSASQSILSSESFTAAITQLHENSTQSIEVEQESCSYVNQTSPSAYQSISAIEQISSSLNQTTNKASQSGSASETISGSISQTTKIETQSISGNEALTGSITQISSAIRQDLAGSIVVNIDGNIAQTSHIPIQTIQITETISGYITQFSKENIQEVEGGTYQNISGEIEQISKESSQGIVATETISGNTNQHSEPIVQTVSGIETIIGHVVQTSKKVEQTTNIKETITGTISQTTKPTIASLSGDGDNKGTIGQSINICNQSGIGKVVLSGNIQQNVSLTTQSIAAKETISATVQQTHVSRYRSTSTCKIIPARLPVLPVLNFETKSRDYIFCNKDTQYSYDINERYYEFISEEKQFTFERKFSDYFFQSDDN